MINDIEVDINKVKASKEDKKVFNNLNKLIIDINNDKVKKEDIVERLNESFFRSTKTKTEHCSSK